GTATRIYWTFKVMGHDKVSILDGGFIGWASAIDAQTKKPVNPLATDDVKPVAKTFKPAFRAEMIVTAEEVKSAAAAGTPMVDNRPYDFYVGLNKSPAAKRAGTIPGAVSLPEGWLTENGGGRFRTRDQLLKLYRAQSISPTAAHITFCNTGHWASLGWFVSSELLGNKSVRMYDGSMAEWTHDASRPVDVKVKLD
ncbi:MAG TPA: rhodanese-like domain-containing protein, partial [Hyphomicrobiaceae bacterium]|nr:rhodanese-like domain-containing protein [Hyphomicrobiaceae bacterium]